MTELIKRCGDSTDSADWAEFVRRYHRRILLMAVRIRRAYGAGTDETNVIADLAQEIYLRLLANDHSVLREFRGSSEPALLSYLSCVVHSVVTDQLRRDSCQKRLATIVSLDAERDQSTGLTLHESLPAAQDSSPEQALLDRLAPERLRELLKLALTGSNADRDALIFQLHIVNGLSMREISEIAGLNMTLVNVEAVIRRTRERLRAVLKDSAGKGLSRENLF